MDFDLREHTLLLTLVGSRAYGLHHDDSDVDVRGIALPPARYLLGLFHRFDQADAVDEIAVFLPDMPADERAIIARTKLEGSVYSLHKFATLAADANPNILDVLFCRDQEVRRVTPAGQALRDHRHLFLSAKARHTYAGYAVAQLKRIRGHRRWLLDPPQAPPTREDFGLPGHSVLSKEQLGAAEAAQDKGIGLDDNLIFVLQQERAYANARREWTQYQQWQRSRNPARAALEARHGYDTKHAAHLVRLLRMGREILTTGQVHVWRGDRDRDELLAVRGGAWTYDRLVETAEAELAALERIEAEGRLAVPETADRQGIEDLVVRLTREGLGA